MWRVDHDRLKVDSWTGKGDMWRVDYGKWRGNETQNQGDLRIGGE